MKSLLLSLVFKASPSHSECDIIIQTDII